MISLARRLDGWQHSGSKPVSKLIGLMPVRNEDWCIGLTLRAALGWCDEVLVMLHACTDHSPEIVFDIARNVAPGRVTVLRQHERDWYEMIHRQQMLDEGRKLGGTHFALVDADELATGDLLRILNAQVKSLQPGYALEVPLYNLRGCLTRYHANGIWSRRWLSLAFTDAPGVSWTNYGDTFHRRLPSPLKTLRYYEHGVSGVMHLWGVSESRLRAKHRLYKVTERIRNMRPVEEIEREYSYAMKGRPDADPTDCPQRWKYADTPERWWAPYIPEVNKADCLYEDVHTEFWQDVAVREAIEKYGPEFFAGLDLS